MKLEEFLKETNKLRETESYRFQEIRPRITCVDGVSLSVQGSTGHYCTPRIDNFYSYSALEVGFPSIRPSESWRTYFDGEWQEIGLKGYLKNVFKNKDMVFYYLKGVLDISVSWKNKKIKVSKNVWRIRQLKNILFNKDNSTNSVYGYVPTEMIEEFIDDHGGIDVDKTFKGWAD